MQLRVARLCLDCEELHTDSSCPRCASESYAFLSGWLQVEERRRWRRPPPAVAERSFGPVGLVKALNRWLNGEEPPVTTGPATRAADRAAQLNFDKVEEPLAQPPLDLRMPKPKARKA